jgi:hypothetical protein
MVEPAHEPPERDLGFNESDAVVGVIRRRSIIKREEHAGGGLKYEQEQRDGAEDVNPAGSARNGFVEQRALHRFQVQPTVEPIV